MATSLKSLVDKATSKTSITDLYRVDDSNTPIILNLAVGAPGQKSMSKIKIGNKILADGVNGMINNLKVGTNDSVNNRFLNVKTIVTDIQGGTNDTFIDFSLTGGPDGKYHCQLSKTVASDGDSVFYEIEIFFFT